MKLRLIFLLFSTFATVTLAQVSPVSPANGAAGIPGPLPNSFIFAWEEVPGVVGYEYLITDNPDCVVGCSGDTRQRTVSQARAREDDLIPGRPYYWRWRPVYPTDTAFTWSRRYAFTTFEAMPEDFVSIPSPQTTTPLQIRLDWIAAPAWQNIQLRLMDLRGRVVVSRLDRIQRPRFERVQWIELLAPGLSPGVYLLQISDPDLQQIEPVAIKIWVYR